MLNLGIDLGTTYSLAAFVNDLGVPTLFPDRYDANEFRTPSVVHVGGDGVLVGRSIEDVLEDEPGLPHARFFKLNMGEEQEILRDHLDRGWWAPALSALVLRKLLVDVEAFANESVSGALITVPAHFNDAQRRATRIAGQLAGLPNVKLMDEPVAAATYYGFDQKGGEQTLFVYDLGGGTFDATVLQASTDGLFALATAGNNRIGGKWIDDLIVEYVSAEFERQYGTRPTDAASRQQLRRFAEAAKLQLSRPGKNRVSKTLLVGGKTLDFVLTQDHFDGLINQLIDETLEVSKQVLDKAGLDWSMIDRILLTGGSSLLPMVTRKLALASGKSADSLVCRQPHQAVAYGAALLANQMFGQQSGDAKLQRICAHDLGIRAVDPKTRKPTVKVMIARNTPVPASARTTFYTTRDDQTRMIIEAVQVHGDGEHRYEHSLGFFEFGPIEQPRRNYPVELELGYDLDGLVTIRAYDPSSGREIKRVMDRDADTLDGGLKAQQAWVQEARFN